MKHRLLLVDDDKFHLDSSSEYLTKRGFLVDTAISGAEALRALERHRYSLVILDYQMPGMRGDELTRQIIERSAEQAILIFSGDPHREAFLRPFREGAVSFVDKREGADFFLREVQRLCLRFENATKVVSAKAPLCERTQVIGEMGMVGQSQPLADIALLAKKLAPKRGPVLILGDSGTGKELIARALHGQRKGKFIAVNCADFLLNPEMARSELFGHVKGAFTGAHQDKAGIFEAAQGGTVFLDEIYALPLEAQVGLLRALQEKTISRLGSREEIQVDFRLVASAKPDLLKEVASQTFKPDLFYRISETILNVPALKERTEDIAPLVAHFCSEWSRENGSKREFLASTLPLLERYQWPGNIRELHNVVFATLNSSEKNRIGPMDLDVRFRASQIRETAPAVHNEGTALKVKLEATEKALVLAAVEQSATLREAGRKLQVAPATVLKMMRRHQIPKETLGASIRSAQGGSQS